MSDFFYTSKVVIAQFFHQRDVRWSHGIGSSYRVEEKFRYGRLLTLLTATTVVGLGVYYGLHAGSLHSVVSAALGGF